MPTYDAIYENGDLQWIGEKPGPGRYRVQVTVLKSSSKKHERDEVREMLDETRGAWGREKSLDAVDAEVQELRSEWDRMNSE